MENFLGCLERRNMLWGTMAESTEVVPLQKLRETSKTGPVAGKIAVQIEAVQRKDSSSGKPFFEIRVREENDAHILRAWEDSPVFGQCEALVKGDCILVEGEFFHHPQYGFDVRRWRIFPMDAASQEAFFEGSEQTREALERDYQAVGDFAASMRDPRLRALSEKFLTEHGSRFRRAAAARNFHHARRGGLCAHTAQMLRSGAAVCNVYEELNRDLLLAGILFHDAGKLWETCPPERGFDIPQQLTGEMLGHICISIELVNRLWAGMEEERKEWAGLRPESEQVRLHLLHLIASHHGEHEFGSPVLPKTPEAVALHFIDNLDAKLEMLRATYAKSTEIAPGIFERARPLSQNLVKPLPACLSSDSAPGEATPEPGISN